MKFAVRILCSGFLAIGLAATVVAQQNTIYKELLDKGVPLSNGKMVRLPQPTMGEGLDAAGQAKVLEQIAAKLPKPKQATFARGGISDPFALEITDIKAGEKQSIGRRIDLFYVAKGPLATVADKDFIDQQVQQGNKNNGFLTAAELKERNLTVVDNPQFKERYAHAVLDLFGEVQVGGIGHGMRTDAADSVLVAFQLDPRFAKDPNYPNQWRKIIQNPGAPRRFGPEKPYANCGAYVKVTELKGEEPRVLVEYHLAYDEPFDWWQGAATLRTKLPIQYEADIKTFRRDLRDFQQNKAKNNPANQAAAQANAPAAKPAN